MTRNNKGFSLIELIVALAILAVAGVAIFGFVVNTSNSYSQTNKEVKLQYEQQLAVNQIRDMIVESDKGIYFDAASKSLALYGAVKKNDEGTKSYPVTVIRFMQPEGKMYFGTKEFASVSEITFADVSTSKLLAENVKEFNVDLTTVKKDKVQFQITFIVGEKEQTAKETVALRNRLVVSNQVDTIWGEEDDSIDSFIKGITIKRGMKTFANGERDSIGKCGTESVVVVYSAVVTTSEESSRDYAVSWSLENAPEGVAVSANGEVVVAATTTSSKIFRLRATSVDDVTKNTYIEIEITDSGIYPETAKLELGGTIDGNGYRTYTLVPTLFYTSGPSKSEYDLFIWEEPGNLPTGSSFDESTGTLILSTAANNNSYTIIIKAKERNAKGEVVSAEYTVSPTDIPEYQTGPTVYITAASTLSRGGYIFPTMVLKNTTNSNYTCDWWIEPYFDNESEKWDTGGIANSSFKLVSLSESQNYSEWNVNHELHTGIGKRNIVLNCAAWINWNKTFKIKIGGRVTDTEGNVLEATPKIITIKPVEFSIARTNNNKLYADRDGEMPLLTDSVLRFEDWNWKPELGYSYTRRRFIMDFENINIIPGNINGCTVESNVLFKNQVGELLSREYVGAWTPSFLVHTYTMICGFEQQLVQWEGLANRPVFMNYSVTLKDDYGNSVASNVEEFSIAYEYYYHTEE